MTLVREWTALRRDELLTEWDKAWNGVHPDKIDPLP